MIIFIKFKVRRVNFEFHYYPDIQIKGIEFSFKKRIFGTIGKIGWLFEKNKNRSKTNIRYNRLLKKKKKLKDLSKMYIRPLIKFGKKKKSDSVALFFLISF